MRRPPRRSASAFTAAALAALVVVDGDTVRLDGVRLRLAGMDAPEAGGRAQCAAEADLAARASARLADLLAAGAAVEWTGEADRYRRPLVVLRLPDGRDAGAVLVGEGLARVWTGRRESWCIGG